MILLLDAHTLLWWLRGEPSLDRAARASIADPANDVVVSAATIWELEIKRAMGKLQAPDDLLALLESEDFDCIPIHGDDAIRAARLPMHHRDPFDRMVLAHALRLDAVVVSRDQMFDAYGVPVLRA
ncbi:MAG: type II toxin-antitoxin system VapC family toxin [Chloroflexi bacterium]|nr:type II toxin-antitoxin system VapC family toxin [Chloroflexota bacterium]